MHGVVHTLELSIAKAKLTGASDAAAKEVLVGLLEE